MVRKAQSKGHYAGLTVDEIRAASKRVHVGSRPDGTLVGMVDKSYLARYLRDDRGVYRPTDPDHTISPGWTCVTRDDFRAFVVLNVAIQARKEIQPVG